MTERGHSYDLGHILPSIESGHRATIIGNRSITSKVEVAISILQDQPEEGNIPDRRLQKPTHSLILAGNIGWVSGSVLDVCLLKSKR